MPSISVVIPAYNVEDYIEESILSVIKQLGVNDELIVIDDGSTDDTYYRAKNICSLHNVNNIKIKIFRQKNAGQGAARNCGIINSECDYIYFLDSDDLLSNGAIQVIRSSISSSADVLMFNGVSFKDGSADFFLEKKYQRPFYGFFDSNAFFDKALTSAFLSCSPCLYVVKRNILEKNAIQFISCYHEDEEIFYRILSRSNSFLIIDQELFCRRYRVGSTTQRRPESSHFKGIELTLVRLRYLCLEKGTSNLRQKYFKKVSGKFIPRYIQVASITKNRIDIRLISYFLKDSYLKVIVKIIIRLLINYIPSRIEANRFNSS